MTARPRFPRTVLLALGLLTATVGGAALAWACTPTAGVAVSGAGGPGFAYPGGQATVAVNSYSAGAAVSVHWNGANGPVLASGTGPSFTASVTIPAVADGNYVIVSRAIDSEGTERLGYAPIKVGKPGPAEPEGGSSPGSNSGAPAGAGSPARSPVPGSTPGSTSGGGSPTRGGSSNSVSGADRAAARTGGGRSRGTSGQSGGTTNGGGTTGNAGVATLPSGQAVFADSVGANTPTGAAPAKRGSADSSRAAPSRRTADGDLWSGFSPGRTPAGSLGGSVGPASGPGSALTLALALAGFGLVALLGGAGAAELRRRRRRARSVAGPRS